MSETELRAEIRELHKALADIKDEISNLNVSLVTRVVRLETQIKIGAALLASGSLGAAGLAGILGIGG